MRIDEGLGGTPADVQVRLYGPDLDRLARLAGETRELMEPIEGIADLRAETLTGLPQVRITVYREAVARVGLAPADVVDALRIGLAGEEVSQVWVGQRRFDLVVGSFAETMVILATLPDAFVGGIVALWLAGETRNVSSLVGLIGLFGIAVQNGLVLVSQTRSLIAEGRPFEEALREASIGTRTPQADDGGLRDAGTAAAARPEPPWLRDRAASRGSDGWRTRDLDPLHPARATDLLSVGSSDAGTAAREEDPEGGGMRQHYRIRGMDCAEEIAILKREIGPMVGGEGNLSFDLLKARMTVTAPVAEREIVTAVERTGMRAQVGKEGSEEAEPAGTWQRRGKTVLTALSGLATLRGFAMHAWIAGGLAEALARKVRGSLTPSRSLQGPCTPSPSSRASGPFCPRHRSPSGGCVPT
jgi:hypothetical protein